MEIDRRQVLLGTACSALADAVGGRGASPNPVEPDVPSTEGWHPLTRSLLERARKGDPGRRGLQISQVERGIQDQAEAHGWAKPPVIKWQPGASEAFDDLSQRGLQALLRLGFASFWHGAGPSVPFDEQALDRVFDLRQLVADTLRVEDYDRAMMRPKLLAKSRTTQSHASAEARFEVRAVAAQIGWLETSLPSLAADAIVNIELLLSLGFTAGHREHVPAVVPTPRIRRLLKSQRQAHFYHQCSAQDIHGRGIASGRADVGWTHEP